MVQFLDPEIVEKVDKSFMLKSIWASELLGWGDGQMWLHAVWKLKELFEFDNMKQYIQQYNSSVWS